MIGMAARKKVNHGGYFCPYQFQCENRNDDYHSWIRYIYPSGYSCIWLCEEGYFGENCSQSSSTPSSCDNSDLTENKGKYIIKNSGGLVAIIIGLIFTQLFYNLFRRLSYNKYKDF
mgnify:CR=1 FL=1